MLSSTLVEKFENIFPGSALLKSGACDYITSIMCTFIWSAAHGFPCAAAKPPLFSKSEMWENESAANTSSSLHLQLFQYPSRHGSSIIPF
jgi:hypothetical protein